MKTTKPHFGRTMILPFLLLVVGSLSPARVALAQSLTNADFETGPFFNETTITGWTVGGHVADLPGEGATSGTNAAALSAGGDTQGDTLSQSFSTISGRSYSLDFDSAIFGRRTGGPLQLRVEVIGGSVNDVISPPDVGSWNPADITFAHYHYTFTASSGTTTLRFTSIGLGNAAADQVVDTVAVALLPDANGGITECDAVGAVADACYTLRPPPCTSGQAFWFPNADCHIPEGTDCVNPQVDPSSGTDGFKYVFAPAGLFTENANNGTATLTGHLESSLHPGYGFDVNLSFNGRTNDPSGNNGPLLELDNGCYVPPFGSGGPVNPGNWHFYTNVSGTLVGTGNYAGAVVQLIPVMHYFQVGSETNSGASGKNIKPGMSGWFTWVVLSQPTNPQFCIRNASEVNGTADFNLNCENPRRPDCHGQIGDFVWQDNNQNGCQDPGEPGIENVQVDLYRECGANKEFIETKFTDQNGKYLFTDLCAGQYTVSFHTPSGYTHTLANQTCNVNGQPSDSTDSDCACTGTDSPCDVCVTLPTDDSSDLTIDCGYIPPPGCTGQIGDFVWQDNNQNGCQDAGEPGIPNVTVTLYSGCGANKVFLKTKTTDQNGKYLFTNLCAGQYTVSFTTPSGYTHTLANQACNVNGLPPDETDSDCTCTGTSSPCDVCVTLPTDSTIDLTIDCGYIPPCTGQIGDFVWQDNNQNGCQDAGEPGIPNVTVTLYSGCGANKVFKTTKTTDQNGKYLFTNLCAGQYTVSFTTPSGYTHTLANQACNVNGQPPDETDSDCTCTGTSSPCDVCVTLPTDSTIDLTNDCGYIPSCPLTVTKSCVVPSPTPGPFNCNNMKPISSISMIWNGSQTINIKAWRGQPGSTLLSTQNGITPGQTVTVTGYNGKPNDVVWEIFDAGSGANIGKSDFHLSCSDADMNGPEDCGKAEGDGKGLSGYINQWIFAGMSGANNISIDCGSQSGPPTASCTIAPGPPANCTTVGKPTSLTFRYTGGTCAASNNPQSGKFSCSGSVNTALPITVSNSNGYSQSTTTVNPGGEVTFSKSSFNAQSNFTLSNTGGTENLSIHTSCSQTLEVGNVFGDFTLVGFNGQTGGASIVYHYAVKNNGATTVNNVFLTDDQLGSIAGPFSLAAGETKTFDVQTQLSQTTTNTATASVQGQNCSANSGPVTVTVTPGPTPTPTPAAPFDCGKAKPLNELKMIWNGSQTISIKAWKGKVGSTLLSSQSGITPGTLVTVTGYAGAPNDVITEIFVNGQKIGQSTFHLSCSDNDMNGPEDCGKAEGDGKGKSGYINDWIFAGMSGNGRSFDCP